MLCSVIDDIDYKITHIFRGEDHINNTAIQLQMLEAMKAPIPHFGHLSFLKAKEEKISKRVGGFEVSKLAEDGIEAMTINSFFAYIGTSKPVIVKKKLQDLVADFDINVFSSSPTIYSPEELLLLNHKLLIQLEYNEAISALRNIGIEFIDEEFWLAIRANLNNLKEAKLWWDICKKPIRMTDVSLDRNFLKAAVELLPEGDFDQNTWQEWTARLSKATAKKGKELYMPIRLALTGIDHGPEMKLLLPLIGRSQTQKRLSSLC
jgi:glutamyl-tRNA synthetase